jgi:DNA-binding beta-propeller fold protein YncE
MLRIRTALVALCVTGCSGGPSLQDGRNPTGSRALITSSDHRALYVANAEEDTLARVELADQRVSELELPGEPTRIARAGERLIVTLRAVRRVAVVEDAGDGLRLVQEIDTGAEPYGVVATEDGRFIYVASSTSNLIEELDGATFEKTRAWTMPGEPRWLAIHPSGKTLYVASAFGTKVAFIDLDTGRSSFMPLPASSSFGIGGGPAELTPRVTGDLAVAPDGSRVAIPALYVDSQTPISEEPSEREIGGYTGRINPSVVMVPVDGEGRPREEEAQIAGVRAFRGGSYPASVAFSPDSKLVIAPLEGSSLVAVFAARFAEPRDDAPRFGPFDGVPVELVRTEAGPRSVAFVGDDTAWVYGFLDRTVSMIDLASLRSTLMEGSSASIPFFAESGNTVVVARSNLAANVERGRRLFYSADDLRMTSEGSAVSCATCHFEGRNDGITWTFERGPRQTPSLAGVVSARAPVRWQGDRATVADDAMQTAQSLMGGFGLSIEDAKDLEAFVDFTREVDLPLKGVSDPEIELGREIFNRPDVGCATCHSGALYSDLQRYDLLGFSGVKTPSLLGVAASGPYFHDGSAATLRDVLIYSRSGGMGYTGALSDEELDALERFLQSL